MAVRTRQTRTRSMRFTLAGLLVIPLASLLTLWIFAAAFTLSNAIHERNNTKLATQIVPPSQAVGTELTQERLATYIWLSSGRLSPVTQLAAIRHRMDAAVAAYRRSAAVVSSLNNAAARRATAALLADLTTLPTIRTAVDSGGMSPADAFVAYSNIADAQFAVYDANQVNDVSIARQAYASIQTARAAELVGREAALVAGAAVDRGRMTTSERALFATAVAQQRLLVNEALPQLSPQLSAQWVSLYQSPAHLRFAALENQIAASVGSRTRIPVSVQTWQAVSGEFLADMQKAEFAQAAPLALLTKQLGNRFLLEAILAGGLGLLAVVASVLLAVFFARRLTRELRGLHDSAQSMASERLPSVVERLRRGDEVNVEAESPPPPPGKITEVADVALAFASVQRTAVAAAVGQANLRRGVNQVFLNLSLRNQSLLHRQLGMLDSMERATSDPKALAELFRLDHLTTRMRRHAEGLIILSGATPGRGWRDPVPVVNVLRAAVAEVEDYIRVDVVTESRDSVLGSAVNDVVHLIAELVENATAFSPPNTQVEVRADNVGNGFAVEVEDRGLGLTPAEMAEINERLANPPEFDLANSEQLGLFVVGQLAARHGIRVSLAGSPYGGVRAIVLLPPSIMARDGDPAREPASVTSLRHRLPGSAGDLPTAPGPAVAAVDSPPGNGHGVAGPPWQEIQGQDVWQKARRAPAPDPASRRFEVTAPQMPQIQRTPGTSPVQPGAQPADTGTHMGLPIRVRQANLAPQLRASAEDPDPGTGSAAQDGPGAPSPEHARSMMASLQDGWRHGRTDDLDHPVSRPGDPPDGAWGAAMDPDDSEAL
jgi:signal transduction histidine kinase